MPGTINIPLDTSFTTWAGWLLPYDRSLHLILDVRGTQSAAAAVRDLAMIGLDRVAGAFTVDTVDGWAVAGGKLDTIVQMTPADVAAMLERGGVTVIDVRGHTEWESGHLPGVQNMPLGYLADRLHELSLDRPIVLHCQGGARSSIGASVLRAHGVTHVMTMSGGYAAWQRAGLPITRNGAGPDRSTASDPGSSARDLAPIAS